MTCRCRSISLSGRGSGGENEGEWQRTGDVCRTDADLSTPPAIGALRGVREVVAGLIPDDAQQRQRRGKVLDGTDGGNLLRTSVPPVGRAGKSSPQHGCPCRRCRRRHDASGGWVATGGPTRWLGLGRRIGVARCGRSRRGAAHRQWRPTDGESSRGRGGNGVEPAWLCARSVLPEGELIIAAVSVPAKPINAPASGTMTAICWALPRPFHHRLASMRAPG